MDGHARPALLYLKIVAIPDAIRQSELDLPSLRQQLSLLGRVLGSSLPGSLGKALRFDKFIAQSFRLSVGVFEPGFAQLGFFAHPDRGVSVERVQQEFETALGLIAERGIPFESFRRVKQRYVDRLERRDDPERFAWRDTLRVTELRTGEPPRELSEYREYAREMTLEQLGALVRLLAGPGRVVVTQALPAGG